MINGYRLTQAIHVAAVLGIAEHLTAGPRVSDDLANLTGTNPSALYRLLRALAGAGVLHEDDGRYFALTPIGECLRRDAPESVHGWAMFAGGAFHWQVWRGLEHSVRTGETAARHVFGTDVWTYRQQHPEIGAEFNLAMESVSSLAAAAILPVFDFGQYGTIVDIGGGTGTFLAAILAKHSAVQGILFDQPHVAAGANTVLAQAGVLDRCRIVGGDFFDEVPEGGDAYVLKLILHDWDDNDCLAILRTCRRVMREGAPLLVVEEVLGDANNDVDSKLADLNMLTGPGGRSRSVDEYTHLFEATGFTFLGLTQGAGWYGIFEGRAA